MDLLPSSFEQGLTSTSPDSGLEVEAEYIVFKRVQESFTFIVSVLA